LQGLIEKLISEQKGEERQESCTLVKYFDQYNQLNPQEVPELVEPLNKNSGSFFAT